MRLTLAGGNIDIRHLIEKFAGLTKVHRRAGKRGACCGETLFDERKNTLAQRVTGKADIVITEVIDPNQTARARSRQNGLSAYIEQRTQDRDVSADNGPHGGRAPHSGAPQKPEKNSLGLIVTVVPKGKQIALKPHEHLVTRFSCRRLQAIGITLFYCNLEDMQRKPTRPAQIFTKRNPGISFGLEAVVNMGNFQPVAEATPQNVERIKQNNRIHTARERTNKTLPTHPLRRQKIGDGLMNGGDGIGMSQFSASLKRP